ncbi:hypothetical protein RND71_020089 [Anisodus tanguticus]|uniref:Uncharacterized protein n=1 Tax=Anisodus tanguticus TaxID=243964 RepID=A0AAE1S0R6_9SOLA|nr:hypothetical protein RND71_020089 [Anisodus tanguticus]
MASIAKNFSFIFLLTLLASLQIHARDGQFFNKVPSNNGEKETQTVVPNKEQEPNFMPENENGAYGLYGHDSVSTPVTNINNPNVNNLPNSKYLPKNYNPVSYVTVPEDNTKENNFNNNNNNNNEFTTTTTTGNSNNNQFYSTGPTNYRNNNNNQQQYYHGVSDFNTKNNNNQQQQFYSGDSFYSNNQQYYNNDNNNNNDDDDQEEYYNAANSYYNNNNNVQQQGLTETRLSARSYHTNPTNYGNNYNNNNQEQSYSTNYNNYNTGKANYRVHQQQGMSDTRLLGNGKFYYDINAEKHARDPYENAREFAAMNQQYNNRNSYGNNEFNNNNSFENEEEFQDEENMH